MSSCQNLYLTGAQSVSAAGTNLFQATGSAASIDTVSYGGSSMEDFTMEVIASAGISAGAITFEQSMDNSTWYPILVYELTSAATLTSNTQFTAAITIAASTNRVFSGHVSARYVRCRISTPFAGGTVSARVKMSWQAVIGLGINNLSTVVTQSTASALNATVAQATAANLNAQIVGNVAHSSASSGNPVRIAGRVNTAVDTTLVAGDVSDLFISSSGQLVIKPFATADLDWQFFGTLITNTATPAAAARAAGIRNYVSAVTVQNTNATPTTFIILDGATTIFTISLPASMALPVTIEFPTPLRGTAATALNVNCGTTGANVLTNMQGFQAA